MELNREKIIKALECCSDGDDCKSCPLKEDYSPCLNTMAYNALALIRELTEENERLRATRYMVDEDGRLEMIPTVKSVRADTVRKMQERLHERKVSYGNITFRVVPLDDIDQIAKELLEETDEV